MIKYLFMDNYRGFREVTIPLVDVNFLVGENSTGKTSILSLLKILSAPSFFMGSIFGGGEEVLFGHFNEVVSAHASDRNSFSVGFVEERSFGGKTKKEERSIVTGVLLTFRDHSGIPRISRLTFAVGNDSLSIYVAGEKLQYREAPTTNVKAKSISSAEMKDFLGQWNASHASSQTSDWDEVELPRFPKGVQPSLFALVHSVFRALKKQDMYFPLMFSDYNAQLVWIAPIRTETKRTYDEPNTAFSSEGKHTPYLIREMLSGPNAQQFKEFMGRVGESSGLFQSIGIKKFGKGDDAPFEVDAVLDGLALNLRLLGYGVSQSLPILVELLERPRGTWFAIQQPEVHLHPRAQAALGDVFFEMAAQGAKRFVIETHSDFTIDRFRKNYRAKKGKAKSSTPKGQILFFERRNKQNTVTSLPISSGGDLPVDQPDSYREFFLNEQIDLLEL